MLVLEILGVRLLAPYVGLTLQTTTAIIGAVLAGIAAGAALGGRAADLTDPRRLLAWLLAGGGILALLTVPVVRALGPALRGSGDAGALVVTFAALLPPAAVLSAVTPTLARLQLRDLGSSGTVVGRLSAWATAGALAGTFVTGFVLVPRLPVTASVIAVGVVVVAAGLLVGLRGAVLGATGAAIVVAAALAAGTLTAVASPPCDVESAYHCVRIDRDPERASGRVLVLDDLRHSYVDLADPGHLEFDYTRWIADAVDGSAPPGRPLDAVFVGGGGFTLPRWLAATRPGSRSRVLEVDGDLVDVARERLALRTSPALRVQEGDARMTMRDRPPGSADVVVGDAFGGRAVPWHLATREWAEEVRRVLRPGGVYALNVIDQGGLRLMRAEAATLLDVFADVRLVAKPGLAGGNLVLVASGRRLPAPVGSRARGARTHGRAAVARLAAGSDPLTDD
ncbi:MAG TPA: fused MFS/spermidine synthase, partial [Thermoleophilaceae bacterium]|nr:fused MFS/spermidine synthase [Thermoleophilaceae bacterium]